MRKLTQSKVVDLFADFAWLPLAKATYLPVVHTAANVVIPPHSEAVFPVRPSKSMRPGSYIIEQGLCSPYHRLFVARILNDSRDKRFVCQILNEIRNSEIRLRKNAPVGNLAAVTLL